MNVKIAFQSQTLGKKKIFAGGEQRGQMLMSKVHFSFMCFDAYAHIIDFHANDTSIFQVIHFDIKLPFSTNFCLHQFSQQRATMICNSRPKY